MSVPIVKGAETALPSSPIPDTPKMASTFLQELQERRPDIPGDFFSPKEEALLKSLFNKYHLSSRLCLIDLLGFDFFQHLQAFIEELKVLRPHDDIEGLGLQTMFCGNFLALYLRLTRNSQRDNLTSVPASVMDKFSLPEKNGLAMIAHTIKTSSEVLSAALTAATNEAAQSRFPDQKKKLNAAHYMQALREISHLNELDKLFGKILSSPYAQTLLLDYNLKCFEEGTQLNIPTPEARNKQSKLSQMPAVADMQHYLAYLAKSLSSLREHGMSAIDLKYFDVQQRLLATCLNLKVSPKLVRIWNENLHEIFLPLLDLNKEMLRNIAAISQGQLTHKQWLASQGIRSASPKTQEEFLETQQIATLLCQLLGSWMEDVDHMAELQLFIPQVDAYRPKDDMENYFFNALRGLIDYRPSKALNNELAVACKPLREFLANPYFATLLARTSSVTYSSLLRLLPSLTPGCQLAQDLLKQLPLIQKNFLRQVEEHLKSVPQEKLQQERDRLIRACSQDFKMIAGLILYFKDVEILQNKKDFLSEWDYDIPAELKQFISLDGLLALFAKAEKAFQQEPAIPAPLPVLVENVPAPTAIPEVVEALPSPTLTVAEVAARSPQDLARELKGANKRRDYKSILEDWDFTHVRTKGSHEIWQGTNGNQVVLPFHNGTDPLKPGTKQSVISQAVAAVESEN